MNFEANDSYYWAPPRPPSMSTSCRLRKTISSTASSPAPWISPILTFSATAVDAIKAANKNDDVNGPAITTDTVDNLGYGYLGMSANTMNVNKEPGFRCLQGFIVRAIRHRSGCYRTVAIESYYGERASVINYPISNTSLGCSSGC